MAAPTYTPLPAAPSLGASDFDTKADAFLGAMPGFGAYCNSVVNYFTAEFYAELPNGSAAAPSFRFKSDTDTGVYRGAADQIAFSAGGTRRMLLGTTFLQLDVPVTASGGRVQFSSPITIGTNSAATTSDLAFSANAVVGSQSSLRFTMETGGYWTWGTGATSAAGGTDGSTDHMRLDATELKVDVPVTGTAVQSGPEDITAGRLMKVGAFGWGDDAGPVISHLTTQYTSGSYTAYGGGHENATPGENPFPNLNNAFSLLVLNSTLGDRTNYVVQEATNFISGVKRVRARTDGSWSPWIKVHTSLSIVGTVSRDGGVPDGAIIETGSNANGAYTKFADGTMICIKNDLAFGSIKFGGAGTWTDPYRTEATTWTFPAVFIAAPNGQVSFNSDTPPGLPARGLVSAPFTVPSTTAWNSLRAMRLGSDATDTNVTGQALAFGRWF